MPGFDIEGLHVVQAELLVPTNRVPDLYVAGGIYRALQTATDRAGGSLYSRAVAATRPHSSVRFGVVSPRGLSTEGIGTVYVNDAEPGGALSGDIEVFERLNDSQGVPVLSELVGTVIPEKDQDPNDRHLRQEYIPTLLTPLGEWDEKRSRFLGQLVIRNDALRDDYEWVDPDWLQQAEEAEIGLSVDELRAVIEGINGC